MIIGAKKIRRDAKPKEFVQVENFIEEGEYDKALELLDFFEKKIGIQHYDKLSCYHLKGQLLIWQGRYDEAIKTIEVMYNLAKSYDYTLQLIDALILLTHIYTYQYKHDKVIKIILEIEKLFKTIPQDSLSFLIGKKAHLLYCQGLVSFHEGDSIKAFDYLEGSIALRERVDNKQELAESLYSTGRFLVYDGELDRGLKLVERSLKIAKESKNMFYVGLCYNTIGGINFYRGNIDKSLEYCEKSLVIFKKIKNRLVIGGLFNNLSGLYQIKGDFVRALEYIEKSLEIDKSINIEPLKISTLDTAIQIAIEINDITRAQIYFQDLEKINNQESNENVNLIYLYNKALILKSSSLKSDQIKASELFKEIVRKKIPFLFETSIRALLNLCDILLVELQNTNNLELLDQIRLYINQILDYAINQKSHWLLVESYLLEIKLDLITLDLIKAQEALTNAQKIAEKHGLNQLIERLSIEQKNILTQKNKWSYLKDSDKSIVELANLAPLKEQIKYMLKKREIFKSIL